MRNEDLSYFEDKEFKDALAEYESALTEGRIVYMDADDLTDIAEYYMVNDRESEALECIRLALDLHPDAIDPKVFVARQQLFHNNLEKASEIARNIKEQDDREVQFLLAEIRIKEGLAQEASDNLQDYYKTVEDEPYYFLYDTAYVFMDYGEWDIALQWAQQLKKEFPKFSHTNLLLSDIMVSCGQLVEAISLLSEILDKDPFNSEAWKLIAEAQSGMENYNQALESIEYLLAIDENHYQGQVIRANCLFHLNRMVEAHEQYSICLKKTPNDLSILYFDSVVLTNLERYFEAYNVLLEALKRSKPDSPERPHIYFQFSYLLSKLKRSEEAIITLKQSYAERKKEYDSDYYLLAGHILLESGREEDAEKCFQDALIKTNDIYGTRLTLAVEYAENEKYEKAVDILEELILPETDMPEKESRCLPYLAYCTYFIPQHPQYKNYLHKAATCNPGLTAFLFSPIYPNTPIDEYGKI